MAQSAKQNKQEKSLVLSIILILGIVIIACIALLVTVTSLNVRSNTIEEDSESYSAITDAYSLAMGNRINGFINALNIYLYNDIILQGDTNQTVDWLLAHTSQRNRDFDYILYADINGNAYTDLGGATFVADREYFIEVTRNGKDFFVGNPIASKITGKSVFHVARPVKNRGKTIGVIVGVIEVNSFCKEVNQIKVGSDGFACIISGDGNIMAHRDQSVIMNVNLLSVGNEYPGLSNVARNIVKGLSGIEWAIGLDGVTEEAFIYAPIPNTNWGFATVVPKDQIVYLSNLTIRDGIVMGIVSTVIILIIMAIIMEVSLKPLEVLEHAIIEIASGDADLTKRLEIKSNNDIGVVVRGFNLFVDNLQDIIHDVKKAKEELDAVALNMISNIKTTKNAISEILENVGETREQILHQGSSVEETADAIKQVTSNIDSLDRLIENQTSGVTQASAAVEEMMGNISSVNHSVDMMASSFNELNENAQNGFSKQQDVNERIQHIEEESAMLQEANAAISSIAEQTNLLAMNAAIEAAHAGEAGKGFSVVADEIRKLSETSTSQSKTIGQQLNNIKDAINSVVNASQESSAAFESVSKKIKDTDQLVLQIKSAMEEQAEGSKQINEALHIMNDGTVEVHSASQEMLQGSQSILNVIEKLQQSAGVMTETMNEMDRGARAIDETRVSLETISDKVKGSIAEIGGQIDQFKV